MTVPFFQEAASKTTAGRINQTTYFLEQMKTILLICVLLLNLSGAWACSCVGERIPEKQKVAKAQAQASLIFIGRVLTEELVVDTDTVHFRSRSGADTVITYWQENRKYTFAVTRQLKGQTVTTSVEVITAGPSSSCGVSYRVGATFLVFAYSEDMVYSPRGGSKKVTPYFSTGMCTRTKEMRYTKAAELRQLKRLARQG